MMVINYIIIVCIRLGLVWPIGRRLYRDETVVVVGPCGLLSILFECADSHPSE